MQKDWNGNSNRLFFSNKIEFLEKLYVYDRDISDHRNLEVFRKSPLSNDVGPGM